MLTTKQLQTQDDDQTATGQGIDAASSSDNLTLNVSNAVGASGSTASQNGSLSSNPLTSASTAPNSAVSSPGLIVDQSVIVDGNIRTTNASGSPYTATWTKIDGSFLRYELKLAGGTAYYDSQGKPIEFDYAVGGSVVLFAADGSSIQYNQDGVTLTYALDHTSTVRDPTGKVVQVYASDHSWKSVTSTGWDYYSSTGVFQGGEVDESNGDKELYDTDRRIDEIDFSGGGKEVLASDGTVTRYTASGELQSTVQPDGTTRSVNIPGSAYIATWTKPDGSFLRFELALPGGTAFYDASGKPLEFDYAVGGSIVLFSPDGSSIQYNLDGVTLTYALDKTATVRDPTGKVVQVYAPDHSWRSVTSTGWDYYSATGVFQGGETDEPSGDKQLYDNNRRVDEIDLASGGKEVIATDGTVSHYDATGNLQSTVQPDGTTRTINIPGSTYTATWTKANGSFFRFEITLPGGTAFYDVNGKPLEFDYAVGGSVVLFATDGSSIQYNTDGVTLTYALDNTATVRDPTGKVVQVYASDHSWKSVTSTGWDYYSSTGIFQGGETDEPNGDKQLYDSDRRVDEVDLASGGKEVFAADGTIKRYDSTGNLTETDNPDGSKSVNEAITGDVRYYDSAGNITQMVDPSGNTYVYLESGTDIFDRHHRLLEFDQADGNRQVYAVDGSTEKYDPSERLTEVDNPDGSKTLYSMDGTATNIEAGGVVASVILSSTAGEGGLSMLSTALGEAVADGLSSSNPGSDAPTITARASTTSLSRPVITGSAPLGSSVELYDTTGSGIRLIATGVADGVGNWSLTPDATLPTGINELSVATVNNGSIAAASSIFELTVADGTPAAPVIQEVDLPLDARSLIAVEGESAPGQYVELGYLTSTGVAVVGFAVAGSSGSWRIEIPEDSLPFGRQMVEARVFDAVGHASDWSQASPVDVNDPETTAQHVGNDLAARLASDSRNGADATNDLQALANEASGTKATMLDIAPGTYVLSHTVYLRSGTIVDAPGVKFVAAANWSPATVGSPEQQTINFTMFANANWTGSGTLDNGIQFRNVSFDWLGTETPGATAVRMVDAQNILVDSCDFIGSNSGTAFEGDDGAVVRNSTSHSTYEYGFDNWNGPKHTVIEGNTIYSGWFGGVSLTASPTSGTGAASAQNNAIVRNNIYGFDRIGVDVTTLDQDSNEDDTLVAQNVVSGLGRGIGVTGPTTNTLIEGNTVSGSNLQAIEVSGLDVASRSLDAAQAGVFGNVVSALQERDSAVAAVLVQAQNASVADNSVFGGGYPTAYWLPGSNILSTNNSADAGNSGQQTATWWGTDVSIENAGASEVVSPIISLQPSSSSSLAYSAPEGQGLVVAMPTVQGAVFTATPSSIPAGETPAGMGAPFQPGTLTVLGSGDGDQINLGSGNDLVYVGGSNEKVAGGTGDDTFYVHPSAMGADIDGGGGQNQLILIPDDGVNNFVMGSNLKDISAVKMTAGGASVSLTLNDIPFLQAYASDQGVSIAAGGPNQTIHPGMGADTLTGWSGGGTVFSGVSLAFWGDTILNIKSTDVIDFTDMAPGSWWDVQDDQKGGSYVMAYDYNVFAYVDIPGAHTRSEFTASNDGSHGLAIKMN